MLRTQSKKCNDLIGDIIKHHFSFGVFTTNHTAVRTATSFFTSSPNWRRLLTQTPPRNPM